MVSLLIGAIAIAAKPLSFSNNFLLVLVERLPKGVQKSWQRKNRELNRFGVQTFKLKSEEFINFDKGKKPLFLACFQGDFQRSQPISERPPYHALQSHY